PRAGAAAAAHQQPRPDAVHRGPRGLPRAPLAPGHPRRAPEPGPQGLPHPVLHRRLGPVRGEAPARTGLLRHTRHRAGPPGLPDLPGRPHRRRHRAALRRHDDRGGRDVHGHQGVAVARHRPGRSQPLLRLAHPGALVPHRRHRDRTDPRLVRGLAQILPRPDRRLRRPAPRPRRSRAQRRGNSGGLTARSTTAASCSSVSTVGVPTLSPRTYTSHSHSSSRVASNASSSVAPTVTPPWLAISAARLPSSAARTFAASSSVPYVAYSATLTTPPSSSAL